MFTGLIEELGSVKSVTLNGETARVAVHAPKIASDAGLGESIAVNGVCLTAVAFHREEFTADVSAETLRRTTLGQLRQGSLVNLERPLQLSSRLGGHLVQGHVDGVAEFLDARPEGDSFLVRFRPPEEVSRYIVEKGSVTLNGISLTIANLSEEAFDVAVIPHTWRLTNLHALRPGDGVNLEVDIVAKYVERMLGLQGNAKPATRLTADYLKEQGY